MLSYFHFVLFARRYSIKSMLVCKSLFSFQTHFLRRTDRKSDYWVKVNMHLMFQITFLCNCFLDGLNQFLLPQAEHATSCSDVLLLWQFCILSPFLLLSIFLSVLLCILGSTLIFWLHGWTFLSTRLWVWSSERSRSIKKKLYHEELLQAATDTSFEFHSLLET